MTVIEQLHHHEELDEGAILKEADAITEETQEEILDRIRIFVSQERAAEELADQGSLDRAADISRLYEAKDWVSDLPPLTVRRTRGRPVDPESFSRFTKWLDEKTGLQGRRSYQLKTAHEITASYLNQVQITPSGERELRPLKWLMKNGHDDAVTDVWNHACQLAGGTSPTSAHVRKALAEWKKEHTPKVERATDVPRGARVVVDKWLRDAHRIMEEYPELFIDAVNRVEADAEAYFAAHKT